jgi:hypothetical protein
MPNVDISALEKLTPLELEGRRAAIIEKNKTIDPIDWDLDELNEMAGILGIMRRRVSGPPKAKAAKASTKKQKASIDDLA